MPELMNKSLALEWLNQEIRCAKEDVKDQDPVRHSYDAGWLAALLKIKSELFE